MTPPATVTVAALKGWLAREIRTFLAIPGLFKELMDRIEAWNAKKYGSPMPGRPYHGPSTFRPVEAEAIFREMLQPYVDSGQVRLVWNH